MFNEIRHLAFYLQVGRMFPLTDAQDSSGSDASLFAVKKLPPPNFMLMFSIHLTD